MLRSTFFTFVHPINFFLSPQIMKSHQSHKPFHLILKTKDCTIIRTLESKKELSFESRAIESAGLRRKEENKAKRKRKRISSMDSNGQPKAKRKRRTKAEIDRDIDAAFVAKQAEALKKLQKKLYSPRKTNKKSDEPASTSCGKLAFAIDSSAEKLAPAVVQQENVIPNSNTQMQNALERIESLSQTLVDRMGAPRIFIVYSGEQNKLKELTAPMPKALEDVKKENSRTSLEDNLPVTAINKQPKILRKFRPPPPISARNRPDSSQHSPNIKIEGNVPDGDVKVNPASPEQQPAPSKVEEPSMPDPLPLMSSFLSINSWMAQTQLSWYCKATSALKLMLEKRNLIATFKCMSKYCSYTTTSPRNFATHLGHHEAAADVMDFLYYCPYCFFKCDAISDLLNHYEKHMNDKFQCGYCFYRSVDEQSCWEHVKQHHPNDPPLVYECPLEEISLDDKAYSRLNSLRKKFVSPLQCSRKRKPQSMANRFSWL